MPSDESESEVQRYGSSNSNEIMSSDGESGGSWHEVKEHTTSNTMAKSTSAFSIASEADSSADSDLEHGFSPLAAAPYGGTDLVPHLSFRVMADLSFQGARRKPIPITLLPWI